jgi:hypothetical protein
MEKRWLQCVCADEAVAQDTALPVEIKNSFCGWGQGGEMTQALYAHMNNKRKKNSFCLFELLAGCRGLLTTQTGCFSLAGSPKFYHSGLASLSFILCVVNIFSLT